MSKAFFVLIHICALLTIYAGFSWAALMLCIALYVIRMFAITAGFHRLLSHRSYKTGRVFQFLIALIGTAAAQKGPLWWAASHRHHHRHSDTELDLHSPRSRGMWWAHVGWVMSDEHDDTDFALIKDLSKFPELLWLDRYFFVPPLMLIPLLLILGAVVTHVSSIELTPLQALTWGGFLSTVLLYHGTFTINSLAHVIGSRRYETADDSRNSFILALITLGEGWHNNHHRYPSSERQGFMWWEIDMSHYILRAFSWTGLVWDLKAPPASALP